MCFMQELVTKAEMANKVKCFFIFFIYLLPQT